MSTDTQYKKAVNFFQKFFDDAEKKGILNDSLPSDDELFDYDPDYDPPELDPKRKK